MAAAHQIRPPKLTSADLPLAFHTADRSSLSAQRRFLIAVRFRLTALVAAGAFGLATWKYGTRQVDWAGFLAALCFFSAVLVEAYVLKARPERTWYEGRAAAESLKTLSWRYAVGGEPFGLGMAAEGEVDTLFLRQISEVVEELRELDLSLGTLDEQQITQGMRRLRSAELLERKQAYERDRVVEQQGWYRRKSAWNSRRASQWTIAMLAIEIGGLASAILKAMGVIEGDLLIFSGVLLGSAFAWLETKQHRTLATAYAVTSTELASVRTKIAPQATEKHWAAFVAEAEGAFSREHTLWKASRGVRST